MDHPLGFVACPKVALDKHLDVAGNRSVFESSDALDTVSRGWIEANRNASTRWSFGFTHGR